MLHDDGKVARSLFPGLRLELFRDEAEGYYLNLTSGAPVWFVMWRIDDEDPSRAWPEAVSLSYNEAGRWLDAQERVDNVPLPAELADWLQAYTDEHYRPEPKGGKRPPSFLPPEQRRLRRAWPKRTDSFRAGRGARRRRRGARRRRRPSARATRAGDAADGRLAGAREAAGRAAVPPASGARSRAP